MAHILKFSSLSRKAIPDTRTFLAILQHKMKKRKAITRVWKEKVICGSYL